MTVNAGEPGQLCSQLVQAVSANDDVEAETAARTLILASRDESSVQAIVSQLEGLLLRQEAELRWWAVRTLGGVNQERVIESLIERLDDTESGVRLCAARALQEQRSEKAIPALAARLSHPDSLMRRLAADALIATGKAAVPTLLEVMNNGSETGRQQAARALALIGDELAIPILFAALDDPSTWISHWANEGLERMGVGMTFFKPI